MKFEIGEIAITNVEHRLGVVPFGVECEIISREYRYGGGMGYDIIIPDHLNPTSIRGEWHIDTVNLKKKKPPEEASWEEIQKSIGWNPTKVLEAV